MVWLLRRYRIILLILSLLLLIAIGWLVVTIQETDKLPLRGVYVINLLTEY
jgi:lipopolysaccharide export system protein LptC